MIIDTPIKTKEDCQNAIEESIKDCERIISSIKIVLVDEDARKKMSEEDILYLESFKVLMEHLIVVVKEVESVPILSFTSLFLAAMMGGADDMLIIQNLVVFFNKLLYTFKEQFDQKMMDEIFEGITTKQ